MIPATMLYPGDDLLYPTQSSPELRRADMYNRARREEMDVLLYSMNPRHTVGVGYAAQSRHSAPTFERLLNGLRNGIGSMLITAGNRIQNPA